MACVVPKMFSEQQRCQRLLSGRPDTGHGYVSDSPIDSAFVITPDNNLDIYCRAELYWLRPILFHPWLCVESSRGDQPALAEPPVLVDFAGLINVPNESLNTDQYSVRSMNWDWDLSASGR